MMTTMTKTMVWIKAWQQHQLPAAAMRVSKPPLKASTAEQLRSYCHWSEPQKYLRPDGLTTKKTRTIVE
jgi:hypothetical protein